MTDKPTPRVDKRRNSHTAFLFLGAGAAALAAAGGAVAQEEDEVVVTGVRGLPRSVQDSPVPIDVFDSTDIQRVSFQDTNDILRTLVPSYSLNRQPISDGATFVRPAQLRGLPTDKTLVLVNSKRRHRAALVQIGGSGTQGPDIATIPQQALKSVEVLRDGAAAQYGSDAIAGVINFILKDDSEGFLLTGQTGQYYEGDGFEYILGANAGFGLGADGFVNISLEYTDVESSNRAEQYNESFFSVDEFAAQPGNEEYAAAVAMMGDTVQPWGQPEEKAFRSFVNAGYTFNDWLEFYAFGNYSDSESTGNFFYRYPGNGTIEDLREPDGSIYSPLEIFPGGFTPRFTGDVTDYSGVGGFRGSFDRGLTYDLSGRYGRSKIAYTIGNTINPSLGPDTPTEFAPGDLVNTEAQFQADFVQEVDLGLAGPLSIAFGATYFKESYEILEGEPASYEAGPYALPNPFGFCVMDSAGPMNTPTAEGAGIAGLDCTDPDDPTFQVVGVGSNGFPGYSPEFSGKYSRNSKAFYADVSADVTEKLFLQAAVRYEDYSDFDSQLIYKFAARYEILDNLAVRGSYGTGFRAPTPGQQGTTNVSTRLPNGFPVATGLFPALSPVAQAIGADPLDPETSVNYSAGVTAAFGDFDLSVDFYRIELEDRINQVSTIDVVDDCDPSTPEIDSDCAGFRGNLIDAGVVGAESIGGVFYFANLFDTVTQGVDIVATYDIDWGGFGSTALSAAANYNKTEFDGAVPDDVFNAEDAFDFINALPNWNGVFTLSHVVGDLDGLVRVNYFGGYENSGGSSTITAIQEFSSETFVDLEVGYRFFDRARIAVGARNVFDNYPDVADKAVGDSCCGRVYRSDSVVDWQGGYYYARIDVTF